MIVEANYFAEKFLGGDHEIKIGGDLNYGRYIQEYMAPNQAFVHDYPYTYYSTILGNAPNKFGTANAYYSRFQTYVDPVGEQRSERQGIFLQDVMSYGRLTINAGVRMDHHAWAWEPANYHGFAPADSAVPAWDNWTGPVTVAGGRQDIGWTLSPRVSAAYDLFGNGKDVIKVSYANYGGQLTGGITVTGELGFAPGLKSGNTRGEFIIPFNDVNGDFVPSVAELNLPFNPKLMQYKFPTPTQVFNFIAVGQAEQASWLAGPSRTDRPADPVGLLHLSRLVPDEFHRTGRRQGRRRQGTDRLYHGRL